MVTFVLQEERGENAYGKMRLWYNAHYEKLDFRCHKGGKKGMNWKSKAVVVACAALETFALFAWVR